MCNKVKSFDEIGKLSCVSKLDYIQFLERELAKSVVKPVEFEMQRIKKEQNEKCQQEKIDTYKKEYDLSGCGKNLIIDKCIGLKQGITTYNDPNIVLNSPLNSDVIYSLREQYKKQYADNKCDKVFSDYALGQVSEVSTKFQSIDKSRIESASKTQAKKRIIFGGFVLVSAIVMFTLLGKKKNN